MQSVEEIVLICINDSIRINHYLEEILVQTKDFEDIFLISKQLRKNCEIILNLLNTYLDLKKIQSNDFMSTIDFFNLNGRE
ncbi:MAG: hypothetical protein ACFFDF_08745 [Candidatus Odinarchaeota archaeon]